MADSDVRDQAGERGFSGPHRFKVVRYLKFKEKEPTLDYGIGFFFSDTGTEEILRRVRCDSSIPSSIKKQPDIRMRFIWIMD
jgi:hypothetical protein